jgi:hypothetical protein
METQNYLFEVLSSKEVLAFLGFMAVIVYLTKDKK